VRSFLRLSLLLPDRSLLLHVLLIALLDQVQDGAVEHRRVQFPVVPRRECTIISAIAVGSSAVPVGVVGVATGGMVGDSVSSDPVGVVFLVQAEVLQLIHNERVECEGGTHGVVTVFLVLLISWLLRRVHALLTHAFVVTQLSGGLCRSVGQCVLLILIIVVDDDYYYYMFIHNSRFCSLIGIRVL
jgi:hypothetical protein